MVITNEWSGFSTENLYPLTKPPKEALHPKILTARADLQQLFLALGGTPQTPLAEVLANAGIQRAIEFGSGRDMRAAQTLTQEGIEMILSDPTYLANPPSSLAGIDRSKLMTLPYTIKQVAEMIKQATLEQADLVLSKGLVSIGELVDSKGDLEDWFKKGLSYAEQMKRCLSANPRSLISVAAKHGGSILMLFDNNIEALDLSIVRAVPINSAINSTGAQFVERMVRTNLISADTKAYEYLALNRKSQ